MHDRDITILLSVLDGLVALRLTQHPDTLAARHGLRAEDLADEIAERGDRITNPGAFARGEDRGTRARVLGAMATALAIGATHDGGVTWMGRHWCIHPHPECPNGRGVTR